MFKKLTGKNQKDYEYAAHYVMDNADEQTFSELVEKDDFLFDFIKQNVAQRLSLATNDTNWKSILSFLKYYSPFYEDFICSTLAKYADEDLTDTMLNLLENGTDNEKTYCAKFFSYIQDSLAIEILKKNLYSENDYLNINCAKTLAKMNDRTSYDEALTKLKSKDDFETLEAVKFLVNYGDKKAINEIIKTMKTSFMAENIAGEIPYLDDILNILNTDFENGLIITNSIINGLGEILPLTQIFDYELYNVFEYLTSYTQDSQVAVVLLNAQEKFELLTENDEYLFDEDKNTKNEILDIKTLLNSINKNLLLSKIYLELKENSPFVYTALDFVQDTETIKPLLASNNQTLVLKTSEILKKLNNFDNNTKNIALEKITDTNIKAIINAL